MFKIFHNAIAVIGLMPMKMMRRMMEMRMGFMYSRHHHIMKNIKASSSMLLLLADLILFSRSLVSSSNCSSNALHVFRLFFSICNSGCFSLLFYQATIAMYPHLETSVIVSCPWMIPQSYNIGAVWGECTQSLIWYIILVAFSSINYRKVIERWISLKQIEFLHIVFLQLTVLVNFSEKQYETATADWVFMDMNCSIPIRRWIPYS